MKGLTYRYKQVHFDDLLECLLTVDHEHPFVYICMNGVVCGDIDANRLIIEMNRMNNLHRQTQKGGA